MREIEPQQARGRLRGIAHEVMVIDPHNGNEQVAYRVAQPCGPQRQERLEGGLLRWTQIQDQHGDKHGEHAVGERAQSLRGRSVEHDCTHLLHIEAEPDIGTTIESRPGFARPCVFGLEPKAPRPDF